ncbi:unnamed protein product [Closterium sp. Yama58-4]|nr:unnamed protein product [Closterium sp. Yama58-4]
MYALPAGTEGDCYLCVPPDPGIAAAALGASESALSGIEAAALGASESALSGTAPAKALHTFTLDSVLARSSTVLPCPAVPSGSLTGLHLPSFSTNLVRTAVLQDARVDTFTLGGQRVAICTCARTGRHLATFTRRPGSSLYTLTTEPPQVSAPPPALACPALPSLRRWWQRAAPHSSSFPPTTAPLQTLHMDVWGPARVSGQGRERYFLLVVDDYSRYTTVFPLRSKGEVPAVLIPWIRAVRLQLRERFRTDFLVLRLHSDRSGEFSSDLLQDFCQGEGILQSFTLPASPQQNGIAERHIGLVMEVARTSMIHAAAPHFLWPFAIRYAAHQLNLWPRVSLPETSPTLRWTGEVGDASRFRVWGSRAFVRDTTADKLSSRAIPCVFLGFPTDAPGWQFYHPTSRRVFASQDVDPLPLAEPVEVTCDSGAAGGGTARGAASGGAELSGAELERAEPGGTGTAGPGGARPGGAGAGAPGAGAPRAASPGGAGGPTGTGVDKGLSHHSSCVSGLLDARAFGMTLLELEVLPLEAVVLEALVLEALELEALELATLELELLVLEVLVLEVLEVPELVMLRALELPELVELRAQELETLQLEALEPEPLELEALLEALKLKALALEALGLEALALDVLKLEALVLEALELEALELEALAKEALELEALALEALPLDVPELAAQELEALELEALELEVLELEVLCSSDRFSCRRRSYLSFRPSRYFVRFLVFLRPLPFLRTPRCLPAPSRYTEQPVSLTEQREPASRPVSPVRTVRTTRRVPRPRPPPVPGTHTMALRPSTDPRLVPLPSPPPSSLPQIPDADSDRVRAASPTVTRLLATAVTDPSFESTAASALVAELVDFAAACRLDYAASLVAESESVCPPSVGGECALGTDVLEDRQEDFESLAAAVPHLVAWLLAHERDPDAPDIPTSRSYVEAISGPYSSQWQTAMDAEMASWNSTGTYVDEVPPPGANIVDGMWIFKVKRPLGSPPVFKAHYVARGFIYGLRQAPHEWHDTLRTTLAALGFAPSTADPSLFLRTDTSLPPFYILVYIDDLVFATADTEALALVKSELQKRHTCTDLGELRSYLGLQITRDRARRTITLTQSHMVQQVLQRFGFQFSSPQSTPLPTGHSLSAPPSDESVEPSGLYPEFVGCLMYLMTCT